MTLHRTLRFFPAQLLGTIAQFLAMFIWTHWLSPSDMGIYAIVWAVQEMVHLLVLAWWSSFVLRYLTSHGDEASRRALDQTEMAVLGLSMLAQILASALALALFTSMPMTPGLLLAALAFILVRTLTSHLLERARAANAPLSYTLLQMLGPVLGLACGVLALGQIAASPAVLLWAYAAAHALALCLALPGLGYRSFRPHPDRAILLNAMRYGAPLLLASLFGWVGSQGLRLVVDHWQGAAAVGLVSVGWWLGQRSTATVAGMVTVATFNLAVERVREGGYAAALPQIAANGALMLAVLVPTVIGVLLLDAPLVRALVAAPFQSVTIAVLPLSVLAGALRTFRNHFSDQIFLLYEQPRMMAVLLGIEAVLTLALCFTGLMLGDLQGAVAGCLAASLLTGLVSLVAARRLAKLYIRIGDIARIALAGGLMALCLWLLPVFATLWGLALAVLAGGGVYAAALLLLYRGRLDELRGR